MGKSLKSRVIFNKRRLYIRDYINKRNILITCLIATIIGSAVIITSNILLINKANKYTKKYVAKNDEVQNIDNIQDDKKVYIYEDDVVSASTKNDENKEVKNDIKNVEENKIQNEENKTKKEESSIATQKTKVQKVEDLTKINFTLLGEIMMGGKVKGEDGEETFEPYNPSLAPQFFLAFADLVKSLTSSFNILELLIILANIKIIMYNWLES